MSILRSEVKRDEGGIEGNRVFLNTIRDLEAGERGRRERNGALSGGVDRARIEREVNENWKVM